MEAHRRKADGRRVFPPQFKPEQVARVDRQELTVAELARELAVAPQLIRQWQRLSAARGAPPRSRRTRTWSRRARCGRRSSGCASWSVRSGRR